MLTARASVWKCTTTMTRPSRRAFSRKKKHVLPMIKRTSSHQSFRQTFQYTSYSNEMSLVPAFFHLYTRRTDVHTPVELSRRRSFFSLFGPGYRFTRDSNTEYCETTGVRTSAKVRAFSIALDGRSCSFRNVYLKMIRVVVHSLKTSRIDECVDA